MDDEKYQRYKESREFFHGTEERCCSLDWINDHGKTKMAFKDWVCSIVGEDNFDCVMYCLKYQVPEAVK